MNIKSSLRELAAISENLKEFSGGYINTSEGVVKDRGVGAHLKRHAGAYVGTVIAPVVGTAVGAIIDSARKKPNIIKTAEEAAVSDRTAAMLGLKGPVLSPKPNSK